MLYILLRPLFFGKVSYKSSGALNHLRTELRDSTIRLANSPMDRRTICLVKAGFEDVWDTQLLTDAHVLCARFHRKVARFEDVDAAEQNKRLIVSSLDGVSNCDHFFPSFKISMERSD